MAEDANLVFTNDVRPVALVSDRELLVATFGHGRNFIVFVRILLFLLILTLVCARSKHQITFGRRTVLTQFLSNGILLVLLIFHIFHFDIFVDRAHDICLVLILPIKS